MTDFAPRAGPASPLGNDERDHDHDEHGEVRVVLHVDEPMTEVREVQVQEGKEYHRVFRKYQRDSVTNSAASNTTMP